MVQKFGMMTTVSREQAIEYGLVEPTPEERAEREAAAVRYRAQREVEVAEWAVALPALTAITDPLSRRLLDLHAADDRNSCVGCDMAGYEAEQPEWPCRTVREVAAYNGVDLPDSWPP